MKKNLKPSILLLVIFLLMAAGFFLLIGKSRNVGFDFSNRNNQQNSQSGYESSLNENYSQKIFISGWLPYWAKSEGINSLEDKLNLFDEINIFAYGVNSDGSLVDKSKINVDPWRAFSSDAQKQNVKIVPTILWGDAVAMHKIFADQNLTEKHITNILQMLNKNNFSGVDIDYEGKDVSDKDNFSHFLKDLHTKISANNKTLTCTVEARTQDEIPQGFSGVRAMSWANDYGALNDYCDSVRIMAYDQVFQTFRSKNFATSSDKPYAPNADIAWVRDVMNYALKYIAKEKLNLGIPTYGWQFAIKETANGYEYAQEKSISYPSAINESVQNKVTPERNAGGELQFVFFDRNGMHLVNFSDSIAIKEKINLAKQLDLQGVSLFKIDGLTDPKMFDELK